VHKGTASSRMKWLMEEKRLFRMTGFQQSREHLEVPQGLGLCPIASSWRMRESRGGSAPGMALYTADGVGDGLNENPLHALGKELEIDLRGILNDRFVVAPGGDPVEDDLVLRVLGIVLILTAGVVRCSALSCV